jgi:eukaryotic-like serine/threonine-protein kinase
MTDASSADRDPIEQLAEEFLQRRRNGEAPTLAEYLERYPDLADEIRAVFPALLLMERADPGSSELARTPGGNDDERPDGVPAQLGDFRILREVGRGGMGVVYEAEQVSLGRRVALKVLPPQALANPHYLGRFEREAKAAARLHHTNIVPVYGVGSDRGIHYYAMQFIHGQALNEVLGELKRLRHDRVVTPLPQAVRADRAQAAVAEIAQSLLTGPIAALTVDAPLPSGSGSTARRERTAGSTASGSGSLPGQSGSAYAHRAYWLSVARVGVQAAEALAYAHTEGILHRDIKPSNLLLDARGHVWVADFGLAKTADQHDLTTTGDIVGTIRYMAPERFQGRTDVRSDVYSLGVTLYELAALTAAFPESDRHQVIKQVTTEEPIHLRRVAPAMPRDLRTIIHKAIDKDPTRRYVSASALAEDLQRFLDDRPIQARPPGRAELFGRWCRRNPAVVTLLATVVLAITAGIAGIVVQWRQAVASGELAENIAAIADRRRQEIEHVNAQLVDAQRIADQRNDALHKSQEKLRRAFYLSDVRLLPVAWDQEDLGPMLESLGRQVPRDGEEDLRNFEWHYWNRMCQAESELQLEGEKSARPAIFRDLFVYTFNADGTAIAGHSVGRPGFSLWDARTGKVLSTLVKSYLADKGQIPFGPHLTFSPDGKRVAVSLNESDFKGKAQHCDLTVWDVATGRELWHAREKNHIGHHQVKTVVPSKFVPGSYLAFDADGARLAACVIEGDKTFIKVWDAATGESLLDLGEHDSARWSFGGTLSFSPDGSRLLAILSESKGPAPEAVGRLAVWDAASGDELASVAGPAENAHPVSFSFSADGGPLAVVWQASAPRTSGLANASALWFHDPVTGKPLSLFGAPSDSGTTNFVQYSRDGKSLWTLTNAGAINIWDTRTQHLLRRLPNPLGKVRAIGLAGQSRVLTVESDGVLKGWEISTRPRVLQLSRPAFYLPSSEPLLSADGKRVAVVARDESVAYIKSPFLMSVASTTGLMAAPLGQRPLLAGSVLRAYRVIKPPGSVIQVRETATGTALLAHKSSGGNYALSANGKRIAIWDLDYATTVQTPITVWNVDTAKQLASLSVPGGRHFVLRLALSADGSRLAVATASIGKQPGLLIVWDAASGAKLLHQENTYPQILNLGFSPDGNRIAFSVQRIFNEKPEFHMRDLQTGKDLWSRSWLGDYAFSGDGRRLAISLSSRTEPKEILIVDAATGEEQLRLEAEGDQAVKVALSPDGQRLLTIGRTARVWDAETGRELLTLDRITTTDNDKNKGLLPNMLAGHFQFRDDGLQVLSVRSTFRPAIPQAFDYEVIMQVWDATPLPDLRDLLAGKVQPASNRERLRLIAVCKRQHRYVAATRLYADAFAIEPALADDVTGGHRFDATCCDLWAAEGHGIDAGNLDEAERTRLRRQAVAWLRADLDQWRKRLDDMMDYYLALGTLKRWQKDVDLAGIRDKVAVAKLPAEEREASQQLWAGVDAIVQADAHYERGIELEGKMRLNDAIAAYRKAIELNPTGGQAYLRLARALETREDWPAAIAVHRKIVEVYPRVINFVALGNALKLGGQREEARTVLRKAAELDSASVVRMLVSYGLSLNARERLDDAITEFQSAIDLDPNCADAYGNIAWVLLKKQKWADAGTAAKKAIEINPRIGWYHNNYGVSLEQRGYLEEGLDEYRKAMQLPNAGDKAAGNLKKLEPQVVRIPRMQAIQKGEVEPESGAECIQLTQLAKSMKRWRTAARLFEIAFAGNPDLAVGANRYNAACYAVLAAVEQGNETGTIDDKERARLRQQAVAWLRGNLTGMTKQAATAKPTERDQLDGTLRYWQRDPDLDGIRAKDAIAKLPQGEREACRDLWVAVAELLNKPWVRMADHPVGLVYHFNWYDEQQRMNANLFWSNFSPDGTAFVAGGDPGPKGDIRLWEVATGKMLMQFTLDGNPWFNRAVFLPDGKRLLTSYSRESNLYLWDVATGKLIRSFAIVGANPLTIAVAPDGKRCLAGGSDKVIGLYEIETGKELGRLVGHTDKCFGEFSPDGKQILTYGPDQTLRLWDGYDGKLLHTLAGHTGLFSPNGKLVLSYSSDNTVRLWDAATGKAVRSLAGPTSEVTGASFLPGGEKVVAWGKDWTVRVWEVSTGKVLHQYPLNARTGDTPQVAVSPDGRHLLAASGKSELVVLDLASGKEIERFDTAKNRQGFSFSPDGRYAAAGSFRAGVYLWRLPK